MPQEKTGLERTERDQLLLACKNLADFGAEILGRDPPPKRLQAIQRTREDLLVAFADQESESAETYTKPIERFLRELLKEDEYTPEEAEQFKEISNALNGRGNGYLENGLDNLDNYYMRRVYMGMVKCIDLLTSLPEWDGQNVVVQGGSQGGALSLITAALDSRVTLCVANHPALADMGAYSEKGRTGGYPHFQRTPGMLTPDKLNTMAYYDVVNFARHIECPVYLTWGYNDDTCPPTTSYAVWNTLHCQKEALITPINEHWTSEDTERHQLDWILDKIRKGKPQ